MSQTKPHPSVPPPPAKSDGEYFPRVFHVVILDPPNSPAVLTRRSGWQDTSGSSVRLGYSRNIPHSVLLVLVLGISCGFTTA